MRVRAATTTFLAGMLALAASAPATAGGTVAIYAEPLPVEASRLVVRFGSAAALLADGSEVPFELRRSEWPSAEAPAPRLLALADLPPGNYTGLRLVPATASLRGAEGDTPLSIADTTPAIAFRFAADPKRPALVYLTLRDRESVGEGFSFAPVILAAPPRRPAVEALGAVTLPEANLLGLFDRASGRVVDLVRTARGPEGLAIDPRLRRAYVACAAEDTLEAVDLADGRVVLSRRLRVGDRPRAVALTPDGRTLLVANAGSDSIGVLDAASLAERGRVAVGNRPSWIRVDRAGRRAFVFSEMADSISIVHLSPARVTAVLPAEGGPFRGEFDRSGNRLYVLHRSAPYLSAYDTTTLEDAGRVYVGPGAAALAVDRRRDRIHVAFDRPPRIEVFDAFSLLPSDTFPMPAPISVLAADDRENNLCAVLTTSRTLRIVRFVGQEAVAVIELPDAPAEVAFVGDR